MIPVSDENIKFLKYSELNKYRDFKSEMEEKQYISLLSLELNLINQKREKIEKNALKLYYQKNTSPNSKIAMRCCDFKMLEEKCIEWEKINKNS